MRRWRATSTSYSLGRGSRAAAGCCSHGERLKITEDRLDQVERFFEKPRRRDDPRRALHRLRAPARAVHRRRNADAARVASCPTTSSPRALGRHLRHARLRLLALARPAHDLRLARSVRLRAARGRRGRARGTGAPAARPGDAQVCAISSRRATTGRAGSFAAENAGPAWRLIAQARLGGRRLRRPLHPGPPHARRPRASNSTTLLALFSSAPFSFLLIGDVARNRPCRGSTASPPSRRAAAPGPAGRASRRS